ncbi:MAG: hypothetical protein Q8Q62_03680 [Mesorhizobium sp.]|nr:hypothetical protein [Mesorhizobium sp.]
MTTTSALAAVLLASLAGCTSVSSNYGVVVKQTNSARLMICHGFDCRNQTKLDLSEADSARFKAIMAKGAASAESERAAIAKAVSYFEDRAGQAIGIRDTAKSTIAQSGRMGQMDCIDESTNTRTLLLHLEARGLLKHHKVERNVSRGFFADGRYPHSTAVASDKSGKKWAIDSWYEPMGAPPDIMPLSKWQSRGVLGER